MKFLPRVLFSLLGNAALFWALSEKIFPEEVLVSGGLYAYFEIAVFFGFLNFFVKPILNVLTLPFRWLTLGLFQFLVNAGLIWVLEEIFNTFSFFEASFEVTTLPMYVFVGFIVAVFNGVLHWFER